MNSLVWQLALTLADTDVQRIRVTGPDEVVVVNGPGAPIPAEPSEISEMARCIARFTGCAIAQAIDLARHCWRETRS